MLMICGEWGDGVNVGNGYCNGVTCDSYIVFLVCNVFTVNVQSLCTLSILIIKKKRKEKSETGRTCTGRKVELPDLLRIRKYQGEGKFPGEDGRV